MFDTDMMPSTRVLLVAAVTLLVLSTVVAAFRPVTIDLARYEAEVHVTDDMENLSMGISVDADRIDFGELPARPMSAEKSVAVTNNEDRRISVQTRVSGNISRHVGLSPDEFRLAPGAEQEVRATITMTNTTRPGYYHGALVVEEQIPFWRWLWQTN